MAVCVVAAGSRPPAPSDEAAPVVSFTVVLGQAFRNYYSLIPPIWWPHPSSCGTLWHGHRRTRVVRSVRRPDPTCSRGTILVPAGFFALVAPPWLGSNRPSSPGHCLRTGSSTVPCVSGDAEDSRSMPAPSSQQYRMPAWLCRYRGRILSPPSTFAPARRRSSAADGRWLYGGGLASLLHRDTCSKARQNKFTRPDSARLVVTAAASPFFGAGRSVDR